MLHEEKTRKVHPPEFKAKVGLEAVRVVKTINEIGQEYGAHPVSVGRWKKAIQEQAKTLFEGKRVPKPTVAHREPERLYSEIGKLKMQLHWLNKKSLGSTCRDTTPVDRPRRACRRGAAMCAEGYAERRSMRSAGRPSAIPAISSTVG